jgi:hypothetical protein
MVVVPMAVVFGCPMMKFRIPAPVLLGSIFTLVASQAAAATFGDDVAFLTKHTEVIVLHDAAGAAKIAVSPAWQGRVLTSTAAGDGGPSFGWINRELIASGKTVPHMNAFGGEDRFWMGPEGGQFALFFAKGVPFDFEHWFTPAIFDTRPFKLVRRADDSAVFGAKFALDNYAGTHFEVEVERTVRLIDSATIQSAFGITAADAVSVVGFVSENRITNAGDQPWTKETGLLSVWILGQFTPSPSTTIVVPINAGAESELGPKVTSNYFGEVPADRLVVRDDVLFFKGDGKYRSKIGISPRRSKAILGSYDAEHHVLTLVQFSQPDGVTDYVNSLWKLQDNPFGGDAENSYNDGPTEPGGKPLGPFYEMESSSPAAALAPGASLTHTHRTYHLSGPRAALDRIARATLGVSLDEIEGALK